jgi:hypothetical protein
VDFFPDARVSVLIASPHRFPPANAVEGYRGPPLGAVAKIRPSWPARGFPHGHRQPGQPDGVRWPVAVSRNSGPVAGRLSRPGTGVDEDDHTYVLLGASLHVTFGRCGRVWRRRKHALSWNFTQWDWVPGAGFELPPVSSGPVLPVRPSPGRRLIPDVGLPLHAGLSGGIRKRL